MYLELHQHIHYYNRINQHLYLTEFGHSAPQSEKHVGPYIRSVWLLHIVLRDQCHFCDWTIGPGEGFLIAKGQVHSLTVREGYEHFWFAFDGPGVPALAALFPIGLTGHQHLRFSLPYDVLKQKLYSCFKICFFYSLSFIPNIKHRIIQDTIIQHNYFQHISDKYI